VQDSAIITRGEENFLVSVPEQNGVLTAELRGLPGCRYVKRVKGRGHIRFAIPLEHEERLFQIVRRHCTIEGEEEGGEPQDHPQQSDGKSATGGNERASATTMPAQARIERGGRRHIVDIPNTIRELTDSCRFLPGYVWIGSRLEGRTRFSVPVEHEEALLAVLRRHCTIEWE
jgi:hypothetical protein